MSYQVLARKYRPKSFETLVGQEHVVRALSHALEQQRLHHAYLFTGTRGVGKTTLSRILAKAFNCETGITAHPCGVCGACTAIDAGRFVDYIEMDAASNRGVDEMASLLEQAVYAPSNARFKVYMIDEVHMLTNHAFNSMLKTLEEPPEHVKFILATTDPQKIPVTVLSRCLQFNLKQMPPGHIVSHLDNILGQEQIGFDVPALRLLAQGAHGSMRDALSLTDQAIAYAAGKVTLDAVQSMLGSLDQSYLIRLLDALALQDGKGLLDIADEMAARSLSYKAALQDLGSLLHQIAIAQMVPAAVAEDLPERADLMRLAQLFGKEEIQLFYQITVHGRNELGLAPDEYAGFSMTLLRMLAFRPTEGGSEQAPANPSVARTPAARPASAPLAVTPVNAVRSSPLSVAAPAPATVPATVPASAPVPAPAQSGPASAVAVDSSASARPAISPAMAALAAARAGSNKAMGGASKAPLAAAVDAVAVPAVTPVPPASASNPPLASVATVAPAVAVVPPVRSAPPQPAVVPAVAAAPVRREVQFEPVGMDDMPPPWDDDVMFSSSPVVAAKPLMAQTDTVRTQVAAPPLVAVVPRVEQSSEIKVPAAIEAGSETLAKPFVSIPVTELGWDGHWPNLAASLPVRAVAQQLAQQSELVKCEINGNAVVFHLRVPLPTLLSSGSVDKLIAALSERFGRDVRIETQIGAVEQTANAQAVAERAARQVQAEKSIRSDSFVQTLMREFGATIATGSVKPI
ncbi:DNA polymerase III subunit gamma/tau [Undibacterium piscinae]|uniref:DNA polymerase III subunit gamma/tau n=1 Tax=Undibacterium piscinae TaxID=2495591 RepID=A0A6M4A5Q3_9BURK|nr:DNA polymerase III subunit gamma/tau [Undibacterium piscinae]